MRKKELLSTQNSSLNVSNRSLFTALTRRRRSSRTRASHRTTLNSFLLHERTLREIQSNKLTRSDAYQIRDTRSSPSDRLKCFGQRKRTRRLTTVTNAIRTTALVSSLYKFYRKSTPHNLRELPGISIIKPLTCLDPHLEANLQTFFTLKYPRVSSHRFDDVIRQSARTSSSV